MAEQGYSLPHVVSMTRVERSILLNVLPVQEYYDRRLERASADGSQVMRALGMTTTTSTDLQFRFTCAEETWLLVLEGIQCK